MKMTAAVFRDIGTIELEEREIPRCPEDGLLVKVHACGICGGDVRNFYNGLKGGVTNRVMGHEVAGEVVETGAGVGRFAAGDRVALAPDVSCGECFYCKRGYVNLCAHHKMLGTHYDGGFAQYIALPPEILSHGFVEHIPQGMPYDQAAFAETAAAVVACQKRFDITLGTRIVIIGDGPVGCLHIEVARALGASKIMMVGMDKMQLAEQFKPDLLLKNDKPEEVVKTVLEQTDGVGADIVICAVPTVAPQQQALDMTRKRGVIVIYGGVPKTNETTQLNSNTIHYNEIFVTGAFSYPRTGLSDALSAIHENKIHAERYITARLPLRDIGKGMDMMRSGEALKVILEPQTV